MSLADEIFEAHSCPHLSTDNHYDPVAEMYRYAKKLEKRLEEAEGERERLKESCSELVQAMHDYEMLSEEGPPYKHRDMMARAKEAIENRELYADPTPPPAPKPRTRSSK